ncbi:MAG: LysM peptidoglycan-binding domain-containing protein [Ardenticatenaceae bacterium]|nr:LysM peptidoglycan-binding domain-containing protein [Anaerolineales bacterium]MCB9007558.1 LysM peptidoglycan-binding domain-containing protein [Ardenticatenaceae bacterium]
MRIGVFSSFRRIAVLLLLFGLLLGATVSTTYAAPQEAPAESYGVYHTVRYGETLSVIALNYGVTVYDILAANPHIVNPNLIYYGTVIFIPHHYTPSPHPPPPPPQRYCRYYHTVRYGDNLINLGLWYGLSPYTIAEANHIYNLNYIYAGQTLCIP